MSEDTNTKISKRLYSGRQSIVSSARSVTAENVSELVERARFTHAIVASEADYLHNYFLGRQPVLWREKDVRPEINNQVVENRAYQLTKDRADSLAGEPITYSAHKVGGTGGGGEGNDIDALSTKVQRLNDFCEAADKHSYDLELVQWMCEVGIGFRLVLPMPGVDGSLNSDQPFIIRTLDPRYTFVVYRNDIFRMPLFAVVEVIDEETGDRIDTVYTDSDQFTLRNGQLDEQRPNPLGMIPVIEYEANPERMGIFEAVLSLFDAINEVESNRVDGVAQFIQSFMVLENVDMDSDEFQSMMQQGAVMVSSTSDKPSKLYFLTAELNQDQVQTLVDHLYKTALSICGMPFNVGGSASTSDTGAAVTMRDGWSNSENRCKETETMFRRAERRFLDVALRIADTSEHLGLTSAEVEIKFTRRNYEAIQSKTQVLTTMLGSGKIHPRLAFEHSGMFSDPEAAYDLSSEYVSEQDERRKQMFSPTPQEGGEGESETPGSSDAGGDKAWGRVSAPKQADATRVNKA